jgi:hypothetical protein
VEKPPSWLDTAVLVHFVTFLGPCYLLPIGEREYLKKLEVVCVGFQLLTGLYYITAYLLPVSGITSFGDLLAQLYSASIKFVFYLIENT